MSNTISQRCLKRLRQDAKILRKENSLTYSAYPDKHDKLTWYFLILGPKDTQFEGGYYIGKIVHHEDYPDKPPNFYMLTESGRFLIDKKICISNTSYHSGEWNTSWTILSMIVAFTSIMTDRKEHGISHIHKDPEVQQEFARNSVQFNINHHFEIFTGFKRFIDENGMPREKILTYKEVSKLNK